MAERSEAVVEQAVRDASTRYLAESVVAMTDDVSPGYKRTEVGVIPEDWKITSLGDLAVLYQPVTISGRDLKDQGYPVYGANGLIGYCYKYNHESWQTTITCRGSTCGTVSRSQDKSWITGNTMVANCDGTDSVDKRFFYYLLLNQDFSVCITGTGQPQIVRNPLASFRLACPPNLEEQRAIATALSDADALIESLDRLIAKKRAIKQAAMQQLLTGQTRLPGFSGEWETKRLGEIGRFRGGSGFPTVFQGETSGQYPFFKVSDMNNEGNETFMESAINYISDTTRKKLGAVVFPAKSIVFAKVGAAVFLERKKILSGPSCLDNNMAGFTLEDPSVNFRFIHYVLLNFSLGALVSTTALPSLNSKVLASIMCRLPSFNEQQAIATALSDMGVEIEALERRRDKARQIKQGMMQQLLTGRVRLVTPQTTEPAA